MSTPVTVEFIGQGYTIIERDFEDTRIYEVLLGTREVAEARCELLSKLLHTKFVIGSSYPIYGNLK